MTAGDKYSAKLNSSSSLSSSSSSSSLSSSPSSSSSSSSPSSQLYDPSPQTSSLSSLFLSSSLSSSSSSLSSSLSTPPRQSSSPPPTQLSSLSSLRSPACTHFAFSLLFLIFLLTYSTTVLHAQTEGDTGYDYNESYDEYDEESGAEPNFDVPIVNVTVVAGQTAVLPCSVEGIKGHKTTWVDPGLVPLTFENRRVVDDTRFSVIQPSAREWNLQIRDITYLDRGEYRCTINTNPVKSKLVSLHVKVPASINHEYSTSDLTAQEGETAVLVCNVSGVPNPDVTWYKWARFAREEEKIRMANTGEVLMIRNVTRQCDAEYECVAYNGVPPPVSKRIKLTVHFAPTVHIATTRLGQYLGKETILDCTATALPHATIHWEKDGNKISGAGRYIVEPYEEGDYKVVLSLRIRDLMREDYGTYHCVASNSLGFHNGSMLLYEYPEDRKTTLMIRHRPQNNAPPKINPSFKSSPIPSQFHHHSISLSEYSQHVKHYFRNSEDAATSFEKNVYAPIRGKFATNSGHRVGKFFSQFLVITFLILLI